MRPFIPFSHGSHGEAPSRDLERVAKGLQEGDILILRTDWTDRSWGKFPEFFTRSPYLTPEAADWIVAQKPKAVGFDFFEEYSARLPNFTSEDFVCHRILLHAPLPMLEQITGLGQIDRPRFDFYAPFYKIAGTEGAPARYFAVIP
jgi:arylformamidase